MFYPYFLEQPWWIRKFPQYDVLAQFSLILAVSTNRRRILAGKKWLVRCLGEIWHTHRGNLARNFPPTASVGQGVRENPLSALHTAEKFLQGSIHLQVFSSTCFLLRAQRTYAMSLHSHLHVRSLNSLPVPSHSFDSTPHTQSHIEGSQKKGSVHGYGSGARSYSHLHVHASGWKVW